MKSIKLWGNCVWWGALCTLYGLCLYISIFPDTGRRDPLLGIILVNILLALIVLVPYAVFRAWGCIRPVAWLGSFGSVALTYTSCIWLGYLADALRFSMPQECTPVLLYAAAMAIWFVLQACAVLVLYRMSLLYPLHRK